MPYATPAEYEAQYGLPADERVALLLAQASDAIDMAFRARGRALPSESGDDLLLRQCARVACQLVRRQLDGESAGTLDVTQTSMTTGPYSRSYTFSGGSGNLRMNRADLASLGLGGGSVGFGGA